MITSRMIRWKTYMTCNPLDRQEGGSHYKKGIQPVEYINANGLDFFEGNILKYITRHRSKNGREDLKKARHYLDMLEHYTYGPTETEHVPCDQGQEPETPTEGVLDGLLRQQQPYIGVPRTGRYFRVNGSRVWLYDDEVY